METPYTDHLTEQQYEHVYEPAEDSFLLLDALEADLDWLRQQLLPCICLEIGSGSGILITALAKNLYGALCLATDINPHACQATQQTAQRNETFVDSIRCNLVDAVRPHSIDLLLFNPPYVVTSDEELAQQKFDDSDKQQQQATSANLVYSWAGGHDGTRVVNELIQQLDTILSPRGVLYLLLLRENKPDEVMQQLEALNFKTVKFMERRIPGEYLYILKVTRHRNKQQ